MNDKEEKELIQSTKKSILGAVISVFFAAVIGLTAFYYTSTNTLAQHTKQIENNTEELKKVTTVPALNQTKISNIEKELAEFKAQYKDDSKENKESIRELRKQNQKMLELLYQIKQQNNN